MDDAIDEAAAVGQRMFPARLRKSPHEHFIACIEEDEAVSDAVILQQLKLAEEIAEDLFAADIEHERGLAQTPAAADKLGELRDQSRRQVVNAEISEIFEALRGLALARSREARDDDEL